MPLEAKDQGAAGVGLARRGGQGPRVSLSGGVCRASFPPLSLRPAAGPAGRVAKSSGGG